MNPAALIRNIKQGVKTTSGAVDALKYVLWLYRLLPGKTFVAFDFGPPVNKVTLSLRNNGGADSFILGEVFLDKCYAVPVSGSLPRVLDLGANAGFSAVFFSKFYRDPSIACVEPVPGNVAALRENLALNGVKAAVFAEAVSVQDGLIEMELSPNDYGHKVSDIRFGKELYGDRIQVPGTSVDSILNRLQWKTADLVKIDIEGYEGALFAENTTWLGRVGKLIIEIHEGVEVNKIREICSKHGLKYESNYKGNWIFSKTPEDEGS